MTVSPSTTPWFTLIEFSLRARFASPFDERKPLKSLNRSITFTPLSKVLLSISHCGTPSKTESNSASGSAAKSSLALLPNKILEAAIAVSRSSSEWILIVISSAKAFWSTRDGGFCACSASIASISSRDFRVKILMNLLASSSAVLIQYW